MITMPRRNLTLKHFRFQPNGAGACRLKKRYANKQQAEAAADIASSLDARANLNLKVYQCPHCSGWHLTKARA